MPQDPSRPSSFRVASRVAKEWKNLPKGWTQDSVKKFWDSLTSRAPKHPVSRCIREMDGKVSNPGAFCGGLADQEIPGWREEAAKERAGKKAAQLPPYTRKLISRGLLVLGREGIIQALGSWPTYAAPPAEGLNPFALTPGDADKLAVALDEKALVAPASKEATLKLASRFLRKLIATRTLTACGDGPCQCGGQCGCKGGSPLSLQPDYSTSEAALPRGVSASRVAARFKDS